jgi:hypothetical protein
MGRIALGAASGNRLGTSRTLAASLAPTVVQSRAPSTGHPLRGLVSLGRGGYYKQATPYGVSDQAPQG